MKSRSFQLFEAGIKSPKTLITYTYCLHQFMRFAKIKNHDDIPKLTTVKILAAPNPTKTKAMSALDAEDGTVDKAMTILNDNQISSKGVWPTIDKVLKSLKQASYQEFVLAIHDSAKQQLLNDVIDAASNMKENIKELQKKEVYQK